MPDLIVQFPWLFAQNGAGANPNPNSATGLLTFLPYIAIFGLWFYLLLLRPQQKQEALRKKMIESLKKNDRVLTSSGIYGTVVSVDGDQDRVLLRVDDDRNVRIAFSRASIAKVLDVAEEKDREKAAREKAESA